MRFLVLVLTVVIAGTTALAATPRVAVVYSAWGNYAFRDEFDPPLQALGWPPEKFENTKVADLVAKLDQFDLVIAAGVGNYENPENMAPYRDQWLAFLNRGGCLLITDASYGSALDLWVNTFGDEYKLVAANCAPMREKGAEARAITVTDHPLLTVPNDLAPLFRARMNIWAHLDRWPEGWQSLVTCRDGKSLFLAKTVGQGLLVVTSEYSFKGPQGAETAKALCENLWLATTQLRTGVEVTRLSFGRVAPGPGKAELGLKNLTGQGLTLKAHVEVQPGDKSAAVVEATLQPGEARSLALPFVVTERGKITLRIVAVDADGKGLLDWTKSEEIAPAVVLDPKRIHLYPRQPNLEAAARLLPDASANPAALKLQPVIDGSPLAALPATGELVRLSLPTAKLASGGHTLTARLLAGNRVVGEASARFFRHPEPRVGLREDGVTLIAGKPFFPFGFYHVSWTFDAAHRIKMAQDLAAAGFNCTHAGIKTLDEWGPFLDECAKGGVYVVTEFGVPPDQVIPRYKNHPAVLAWNPGDEPELNGLTPETMFTRYDQFKHLDPDHLVYTTCASPGEYGHYARGTEVLAPDPYPIPNAPVSMVYDYLSRAVAQAKPYGTPVWGVLQCFGGYSGWTRPPTAKELRAMTYLALLAGVKGIIYYTYADGGWSVTAHPEQWEAAKALVPEIKRLAPALMDGHPTVLSEGQGDLYAGYWEYGGSRTVVIVNNAGQERPFECAVPGKRAEALFGGGAAPVLAEGKLTGKIEGLGTMVVLVSG